MHRSYCDFLLISKGLMKVDEELPDIYNTRTITIVLARKDICIFLLGGDLRTNANQF